MDENEIIENIKELNNLIKDVNYTKSLLKDAKITILVGIDQNGDFFLREASRTISYKDLIL